MPRQRFSHRLESYGEYQAWQGAKGGIPQLIAFRTTIAAHVGVEFGYVLHLLGGKGKTLDFRIDHPPWRLPNGRIEKPFVGQYVIRHNDYRFFLGDTLWEPWEEKCGPWTLTTRCEGQLLAEQTFHVLPPAAVEDQ